MPPESWLVVTIAAAFLLLGIAASPLAWIALLYHRSGSERPSERRVLELASQLRALQVRLERCETSCKSPRNDGSSQPVGALRSRPTRPWEWSERGRATTYPAGSSEEAALIAVPNLAAAANDREAALQGLTQRYAAIWTLADTGASAEVIARATGQPIGQIELILGLRRQIDGARTTLTHAPHE
jgi:hypothetical protein